MRQAVGDVCLERHFVEGGGGWRAGLRQMRTLLSSGCTPRKCKEEGACLPGQQKEWDLCTSVKVIQVMSVRTWMAYFKGGLNMRIARCLIVTQNKAAIC